MRYFLLTAVCLSLAGAAQAQSWETAAQLTGTGFNFRGASAERQSFINYPTRAGVGYTNNPYGARRGVGYGVALQQQRVLRSNTLLGLQAGYERLRSRVDNEQGIPISNDLLQTGFGHTDLIHDFINVQPYLGQRLGLGEVSLDLTAGLDLGILLHCQEKGFVEASGGPRYTTDLERAQPRLDLRPRLGLAAWYRHLGLTASYSHGLSNYRSGWVGGVNEAYSQVWRLGVAYRLL